MSVGRTTAAAEAACAALPAREQHAHGWGSRYRSRQRQSGPSRRRATAAAGCYVPAARTEEESAMRRMTAAHGLRWRLPRRRCARLGWGWEWGSARLLLSMLMVISEGGNRYSHPSTGSSVPAPRAIGSSPSSFPRSTPQRLIVPCRLGNADGRLAGAHASQVRFASAPPLGRSASTDGLYHPSAQGGSTGCRWRLCLLAAARLASPERGPYRAR